MYLSIDCVSTADVCELRLLREDATQIATYPRRAQEVLTCIAEFLADQEVPTKQLIGLAVVSGVGSFMGGRISVSAINGLGQSLGIPVSTADKPLEDYASAHRQFIELSLDAYAIVRYASEPNATPNA